MRHLAWKKILLRTVAVVFAAFIILVIARVPHAIEKQKTDAAVAKIHATKLTLDDVMGKNLPPDPAFANATAGKAGAGPDDTIQGIDANHNGIRDDVELAIFKEYLNSAKTRAVLLQYALALQMEVVQPIVNTGTVTEVVTEQSRADTCVADILVPRKSPESTRNYADIEKIDSYTNFVKNKQLNTDVRKAARKNFLEGNLGSYGESKNTICDIDFSILPN